MMYIFYIGHNWQSIPQLGALHALICWRAPFNTHMDEVKMNQYPRVSKLMFNSVLALLLFMPPTHSIAGLMNRDVTIMNPASNNGLIIGHE